MRRIKVKKRNMRIMRDAVIVFVASLALLSLVGTLLIPAASAAESYTMETATTETDQVTLTVNQHFVSSGFFLPLSDVFTYRLMPITIGVPMPIGSNPESYYFTIAGTRALNIDPISFTDAGVYVYELRCVTADRSGYTIDRRVYTIEVHVTNDLTAVMVAYISDTLKTPDISFEHSYRMPPGGRIDFPDGEAVAPAGRRDLPDTEPVIPGSEVDSPDTYPDIHEEISETPDIESHATDETPSTPDGGTDIPGDGTGTLSLSPQTGDFSNPEFWKGLILVGYVLLILVIYIMWKSRQRS